MIILERLLPHCAVITEDNRELTVSIDVVAGCREGDVLALINGKYVTDRAETEKRKKEIISLQNSLWE